MVGQLALQPRHVGALGQPEAAAEVAEAALVRGRCRWPSWSAQARRRWPPAAAARGWPPRSTAPRRSSAREGAEQVAAARLEGRARRARSRPPRGAPPRPARARRRARARRASSSWIARADLAQEAQEALARLAAHRLELVAEHGRQPDRDRRGRRAGPAAAGRRSPPPPTATPRRRARCRSPRRRACASAGRARAPPVVSRRSCRHGDGAAAGARGTRAGTRGSTSTPITIGGERHDPSLATVLKAAWIAIRRRASRCFS